MHKLCCHQNLRRRPKRQNELSKNILSAEWFREVLGAVWFQSGGRASQKVECGDTKVLVSGQPLRRTSVRTWGGANAGGTPRPAHGTIEFGEDHKISQAAQRFQVLDVLAFVAPGFVVQKLQTP